MSKNQYFVGVQYPEEDIDSVETLLDIPITGPSQAEPIPLRNIATLRRTTVPTEITHTNLQPTIDLTMGVHGRDLGHVADDVDPGRRRVRRGAAGRRAGPRTTRDVRRAASRCKGSTIVLSGEYSRRCRRRSATWAIGLILAALLIYFLMVALFRSYLDAAGGPARPCRSAWSASCSMLYLTGHGAQRAVAAGRDLHGRHRGLEHGAADRLRPEPAAAGGADARPRRSARRRRSASGR